jgi:hypothetical protein
MTQQNIYVLEGGASNQVWRIIGQNFFLKSDINFIRQFCYQTDFLPISECKFESLEAIQYYLLVFWIYAMLCSCIEVVGTLSHADALHRGNAPHSTLRPECVYHALQ